MRKMLRLRDWRIERCGLGLAISVSASVFDWHLARYWHYVGLPRRWNR